MAHFPVFSGRQLLSVCEVIGYQKINQRGSHVKIRKIFSDGTKHTLTFPMHNEIKLGLRKHLIKTIEEHNPGIDFLKILRNKLH